MGCHLLLQCMKVKSETSRSVMSDSATSWTAAYQAPLPMGFSRQEYWSGLPLPSPEKQLLLLLSHFSRFRLCVTPWTAAYQAPPSMGFSRQEYWSGLPLPSPMKRPRVPQNMKHRITICPSKPLLGIHQRTTDICPHENLYINVHSSIADHRQKVETT